MTTNIITNPTPESIQSVGLTATDDAGLGDVASDVNATDFTSQSPEATTFFPIKANNVVTVVHKANAFNYVGVQPVNLGVGGGFTSVAADYAAIGTADHALLINRSNADQHPQSAISTLVADQSTQDQNLVDHETAPDPHTQYVLVSEAIGLFVPAAYGGVANSGDVVLANITSSFQTLFGLDTGTITTPKGITQDTTNSALVFNFEGVFSVSGQATLTFVEVNSGREIDLRFFNATDGLPIGSIVLTYFVGRNQGGVAMPFTLMLEIPASLVGKVIQVQVASPLDTFTIVTNIATIFQANHVSELLALP